MLQPRLGLGLRIRSPRAAHRAPWPASAATSSESPSSLRSERRIGTLLMNTWCNRRFDVRRQMPSWNARSCRRTSSALPLAAARLSRRSSVRSSRISLGPFLTARMRAALPSMAARRLIDVGDIVDGERDDEAPGATHDLQQSLAAQVLDRLPERAAADPQLRRQADFVESFAPRSPAREEQCRVASRRPRPRPNEWGGSSAAAAALFPATSCSKPVRPHLLDGDLLELQVDVGAASTRRGSL